MSLRRPRVIVVEDDPDVLLFLRLNLESAGYDTSLAADGSTAMRRIEHERPDLVILDLMLPLMDGWAVLGELHDRPDAPKVIVCSAQGGSSERARARGLGVVDFVVKPFDIRDLLASVQRALAPQGEAGRLLLPELGLPGIEPA
ncbi:MAG: response regulator transcription factor [Candidatus Velamenicoccus archaeovorus]